MRILHTSDWHLGRSFHRVDLHSAQAAALAHIATVVRQEKVDVVVVSGDVYDRALPSVDTVELLDDALDEILGTGAQVLLTSGNHDSSVRLGFGARRSARAGLHVRAHADRLAQPLLLEDAHGPVALYGIPYLEPGLVASQWEVARSHQAVLGAAMDSVRADLSGRGGVRSVVAAHAFVIGGEVSDSERDIRVGGVDTASSSVFDGAGYVALGHLHGRQQISPHIRYSGSLLPYSFSEAAHHKGAWLVDLDADGVAQVEAVELPQYRRLAILRGELADLVADARHADAEDAFCQITLTDTQRPRDAMDRLRERFPHTVSLMFEPQGVPALPQQQMPAPATDDADLCCSFLRQVRGHDEDADERELIQQALESARIKEMTL